MKRIVFTLIVSITIVCEAIAQNDAMFIYRNDGIINAFLKADIDSIRHSPLDLDSLMHSKNVVQEVWTVDSVYRIPLESIDSISFISPPTIYKNGVIRLEYNLLDYIIGADDLTLKLKPNTPTMLVPVKGDKLVLLEGCDALPYGFSGIVANVQQGSSSIDVVCEQAYLEDLFDSFCDVSTVYGCNPDSIDSPSGRRRVIYNPNDIVLPLGPYQVSCSGEISQGIVPGGDLALNGGANFSVEIQPTFRIHTLLIWGEGQGVYFNCSVTGSLRLSSNASLYGGLSFNHDFDRVVRYFPIPHTAGVVNYYINPGVFVRANATITSKTTTTHVYTFGMAYDYSSKGLSSVNPNVGGRLASSSVDMEGSLDGSLAGGGYIETGFSLLCREISRVCVRGEVGYQFGGNFVLRNSDIDDASSETELYERLKASSVEMGPFVNVGLYASVGTSEASAKWEISHTDLKCDLVPTFSNTKLTKTPNTNNSVHAYTELRGNCLFPIEVGYKLLDEDLNEVGDYIAGYYSTTASKMEHTFAELDEGELYNYKVFPKVKLYGYDILASPAAGLERQLCPDNNHPHAIDLGLPSGTKWCCCNVGANKPEDYGGYYAWGETKEKSDYNWDTYAYCYYDSDGWPCCTNIGYDIAGTGYDAATVNMGAPWRMPTIEQIDELMNVCSLKWTQKNGVNGFILKSPNDNQIFLPAAGFREHTRLDGGGDDCYYWSSSHYGCLYFWYGHNWQEHTPFDDVPCLGGTVRSVCP